MNTKRKLPPHIQNLLSEIFEEVSQYRDHTLTLDVCDRNKGKYTYRGHPVYDINHDEEVGVIVPTLGHESALIDCLLTTDKHDFAVQYVCKHKLDDLTGNTGNTPPVSKSSPLRS
jgi:hypothetical protein